MIAGACGSAEEAVPATTAAPATATAAPATTAAPAAPAATEAPAPAAAADSSDAIKLPIHNWSSQIAGVYAVGAILEATGNSVEYISADSSLVYTSMCEGDMDLVHEVWEGAFGVPFMEQVDKGCVIDAGTHDAKTREDWWYPSYVEDVCPGLPDWEALNACASLFATPDSGGKGRFLGGPVDWLKGDQERVDGLGMDFIVENAGTAGALWAALDAASVNQEPVVIFNWTPNFVEAMYEGSFIEFPEFADECRTDASWGLNPETTHDCGNPKDGYLKLGVWSGFPDKWPNAYKVVQKMNFTNLDVAQFAMYVDIDGMEPEDAAALWLADNCARWTGWASTDASACPEAPDAPDAPAAPAAPAAPVSALEAPTQVTPACDATVPGSEIVYGPFYAGRGFDPPYSSGALVGGTELAAVYDTLIRYNPETAGYEPQLARDMTVNEDFTVWTLHLRDGITYDDGTPLDAAMVVANHERFFTPTSEDRRIINTSPAFLQFIGETKVIDSLTVEFHLTQPWASFPFVLSDEPGFIININAVGDDPEAFNALPPAHAGVGAYTVEKNTPGEEIVFKARDNYWGGPVCVETLRFNMAAASALIGATGAYEAFQNGDLTTAFLRDSTAIAQAEANGAKMSMDYQDAGAVLYFNHGADSPTSDATLREAISLAIDIDVLNDRAHNGDMRVAKSVVIPGSPYYTDAVLEGATDAARAAELVAGSGFSGTLRLLCGNRGSAVEIGLAVEAMLEAVGLDVEINAMGTSAAIAEMIAGNYDLNCGGWNAGGATAISSYVRNLQSTSPSNRMGYENAEMDGLLLAALSADKPGVPAALAAINNMIVTEWVVVPYGALPEGIVIADNLEGVKQTTSTIFLFDDAYFTE